MHLRLLEIGYKLRWRDLKIIIRIFVNRFHYWIRGEKKNWLAVIRGLNLSNNQNGSWANMFVILARDDSWVGWNYNAILIALVGKWQWINEGPLYSELRKAMNIIHNGQ